MSTGFYEIPNLIEQFQAQLIKERVDIITFAESPKYLGYVLYPRQKTLLKILFLMDLDDYDKAVLAEWQDPEGEVLLCPKLQERMQWLKDNNYPHFHTMQLVGGRRSSKGFLTGIIIAYKAYLLTLFDDMHKHLNIPEGKEVSFPIIADSLDQAKAHQFSDASDAILACKQLRAQKLLGRSLQETQTIYTPGDLRRQAMLRSQGARIDRDMASLVIKAHGTNSKTLRGSASLMFTFDEMAHLVQGESRMSDTELWNAALYSVQQFRENGMLIANSSPYQKTGKFFKLWEESLALDPPDTGAPVFPDHFSMQFPSWTLYQDWEKFNLPPPQMDTLDRMPSLKMEEQRDPETFRVEVRAQWAEVQNAFLNPDMIDRAFDPKFNNDTVGRLLTPTVGATGYMRYKGHGDPSAVGPANFGLAIGHVEEYPNASGQIEQHVIFDFVDAFYPEDFEDHTIDWLEVVPAITTLIDDFRPFEWTFDQFDSRMAIQQLTKNLAELNVPTNVYEKPGTNKLNDRRWKNFRAALNLGRIHIPHPDTFNPVATKNSLELARNELKYLVDKNGKVEHQTIGPVKTKDIADCLAEVVDALIGDTISPQFSGLDQQPQLGVGLGPSPIQQGNTAVFPDFHGWYRDSGGRRGPTKIPYDPARGRKVKR